MRNALYRLFTVGSLLLALPHVALAYDEGASGDLSNNKSAPTPLTFATGSNVVTGTLNSSTDPRDYLTFTVPAGRTLSAINLTGWSTNRGFNAINAGSTSFTPGTDPSSSFLGGDHVDPVDVGHDLLTIMSDGATKDGTPVGHAFTLPLAAGTYSYEIQQTNDTGSYGLSFVISAAAPTPAPAANAWWLLALTAALLAAGALLVPRARGRQ